jgi:DNA-directed RNA polymerase specialized sigma24 family protein
MSTNRKSTSKLPYEFIAEHYRDPGGEDPIRRWLPHPEVARAICGALLANGVGRHDLEDRLQDVYVKALDAFREGSAVAGPDLRAMKAFCATVARNLAIDLLREAEKRKRDLAAPCPRDEYGLVEPEFTEPHERVDAARQLDVLAVLFREGRMPRDGVAILEGVAAGCSHATIAQDLGISKDLVAWRMREMRRICRQRMAKLGLLGGMQPLRAVVCEPFAMTVLRAAA